MVAYVKLIRPSNLKGIYEKNRLFANFDPLEANFFKGGQVFLAVCML